MRILLELLIGFGFSAAAIAAQSEWVSADRSRVRLLVGEPAASKGIEGGVEVMLEPGWHTYWRNPGETGIPPIFDFSASENVADIEVFYPAPERYDDGSSVSLIYRDEVVFPLTIVPRDAEEPVVLRAELQFGVCKEVCIPTRASAELTLPQSSSPDPLAEARLERFRSRLPGPPEAGTFDIESVVAEDDALVVDVRMPDSTYSDLFVDPPNGWYIGQPELVSRNAGVSRYRLSLAGQPGDETLEGEIFRFVAVAGGKAIEEAVPIR
jgi:DsbC/DsbD-like thiol-disulfide interchange protein